MEKTVRELKTIMRDMILEIGALKERVAILEQNQVIPVMEMEKSLIPPNMSLEGESYENIGKIYNQGYHVCSMAYGQVRSGECLFCVAFLEKE